MRMRHWTLLAILALAMIGGCHSTPETPETQAAQAPSKPIPPDSIFAKVKIGMGHEEAVATIGQPTSEGTYQTGKAYIPFHYGGDNFRTIAHYKGVGNIIFSSDSAFTTSRSIIEINYDPTDRGF